MASLKAELKQERNFESGEQEALLNLQRTVGVISGPFFKLFKSSDLSTALYNILRILRGQKGKGLSCSSIGERMVTRDPDVTRLADKLLKMELVRRDRSTEDRRVVLISLTEKGKALLNQMDEPVRSLHQQSLGHMTKGELKELNRLLVKARQPHQGDIEK